MPKWSRLFRSPFLLRAAVRELRGIKEQLARQNDLLEAQARATGIVPPAEVATVSPRDLADTGISYLDATERGIVEDYITRTRADTGRDPSEDEILVYLADEKTIDLQQRLKQREALADLDRLGGGGGR